MLQSLICNKAVSGLSIDLDPCGTPDTIGNQMKNGPSKMTFRYTTSYLSFTINGNCKPVVRMRSCNLSNETICRLQTEWLPTLDNLV